MTAIRKLPLPAPVSIRVNSISGDLVPMRFEPLLRWECKANLATNSLKWTDTFDPNCSYSLVSSVSGIFRSYFYLFWSGLSLPTCLIGSRLQKKPWLMVYSFLNFLLFQPFPFSFQFMFNFCFARGEVYAIWNFWSPLGPGPYAPWPNGPGPLIIWKNVLSQICSRTISKMHTAPGACLLYAPEAVTAFQI